jgi:DNA-directed RNA polymerase subunit RPC12/RpoP
MRAAGVTNSNFECLNCGEKISRLNRYSISLFSSLKCPYCGTRMTFQKRVFALMLLLSILVVPALIIIFYSRYFVFGILALAAILGLGLALASYSRLKLVTDE